jgi:hypothetical protein
VSSLIHMPMHRVVCCLAVCLAIAAPARAQQKESIAPFIVDIRGAFARHKAEPSVATDLGVTAGNLPSRSIGLVAGAHVYPLRGSKVTLGLGGNVVIAHGSLALNVVENGVETPTKGPTVRRHFTAFSPEVSLNFGHRNGWSYISGGMFGRSKLYVDRADAPVSQSPYRRTLNYGGGARWFTTDRVAFSVDFRWYSVAEQLASAGLIAQPRTTLLVLSGGISVK